MTKKVQNYQITDVYIYKYEIKEFIQMSLLAQREQIFVDLNKYSQSAFSYLVSIDLTICLLLEDNLIF